MHICKKGVRRSRPPCRNSEEPTHTVVVVVVDGVVLCSAMPYLPASIYLSYVSVSSGLVVSTGANQDIRPTITTQLTLPAGKELRLTRPARDCPLPPSPLPPQSGSPG